MRSGAVIAHEPDIDDLVPPQALSPHPETGPEEPRGGTSLDAASFPKVIAPSSRQFLFRSGRIFPPKPTGRCGSKVALGFALLAGSWITLCAVLNTADSWKFVAVHLCLGGLAQDIPFAEQLSSSSPSLSPARQQPQCNLVGAVCKQSSELCFRCLQASTRTCGVSFNHQGQTVHSCVNLHGEDDALTGRGINSSDAPRTPRACSLSASSISMRCFFMRCFLLIMC